MTGKEDKNFDWNDVKVGDAFIHRDLDYPSMAEFRGKLMYYCGRSPTHNADIFEIDHNWDRSHTTLNWMPRRENLKRFPDSDIN